MSETVVIVGGNAGGASTAARLRRMDESADIVLFERGTHVSFGSCGLPYYLSETIPDREDLLVQTPEALETRFDLDVRTESEVVDVDADANAVTVRADGDTYEQSYDTLVLSPGAEPIEPPIEGLSSADSVYSLQTIEDATAIKEEIESASVGRAVVVGGGYIGLEAAENLYEAGLDVSLVELQDQLMQPIDEEMAAQVHNHVRSVGLDLRLDTVVEAVRERDGRTTVRLDDGVELDADLVVLSTGVRPRTDLAEAAGVEIGNAGGIVVDDHLRTTDPDIYAVGDAVEVRDCVTKQPAHVPLAGPANEQGRIVANNIAGVEDAYDCVQGTSIAKVFEKTAAVTGCKEATLQERDIPYEKSYTWSKSHAGYYPGAERMWVKVLFDPDDGTLYGAQIVGGEGVDKRIDVLATALRFDSTVFDLQELDLAYAPPFGSAKDPVNMAGYAAGNVVADTIDVLHWHDVEDLDPERYAILDCRPADERREDGFIDGSINVPLGELRDRLDELPPNKTIVPHCKAGLRSYIATRILVQNGFDAKNLAGGYELFSQIEKDRKARGGRPVAPQTA